jgi:hypothetical protein
MRWRIDATDNYLGWWQIQAGISGQTQPLEQFELG